MFRIENGLAAPGTGGDRRRVVDHDRFVSLRCASELGDESGATMVMTWLGRVIVFEIMCEFVSAPPGGRPHSVITLSSFGTSSLAIYHPGMQRYVLDNPERYRRARMLAAEALLLFGTSYDGERRPEGYYRVVLDDDGGRAVYTLKSFGYEGVALSA
jgi:hypothetical protein